MVGHCLQLFYVLREKIYSGIAEARMQVCVYYVWTLEKIWGEGM